MEKRWVILTAVAGLVTALIGQVVLRWNRAPGIEITDHVEVVKGGEFDGLDVAMRIVRRQHLDGPVPGVVVAHGFMASGELYDSNFVLPLARAGYIVASIDERGHGNTGGAMQFPREFPPEGFKVLPKPEITAAMNALRSRPDVDPQEIGVVGHSMGGHAVTDTALLGGGQAATVAIAGISDWKGDWSPARNFLFLNCKFDEYIFPDRSLEMASRFSGGQITASGQEIGDFASGTARGFIQFDDCDHLTELYHPGISRAVISWLDRSLGHVSDPLPVSELWIGYVRGWIGSAQTLLGILLATGALVWYWGKRTEESVAAQFAHNSHELSGGRLADALREITGSVHGGHAALLPGFSGWKTWTLVWFLAPLSALPFMSLWDRVPLALSGPVIAVLYGAGVLSALTVFVGTSEDERAELWDNGIRGFDRRYILCGLFAGAAAISAIALAFSGVLIDYWPTPRKWAFAVFFLVILLPPFMAIQGFIRVISGRARTEVGRLASGVGLLIVGTFAMAFGLLAFHYHKMMPLEWVSAATAVAAGLIPLIMFRRRDELPARTLAWAMLAAFILANLLPVRVWE